MKNERKNDLFLQALQGKNVGTRPPVWLMRQAGRYMASYRKLRGQYSFLELCKEPELVATVTELPIQQFGFDAAIVFSDILLIVEALGFDLRFEEDRGPIIEPILSHRDAISSLRGRSIMPHLDCVVNGVKLIKQRLDRPLIGFAGAPFTIASYLIEGKSSRELRKTKQWMLCDPESFHQLLDLLSDYTIEYLNHLIDAGVDAIQLFDSWTSVLAYPQFEEFSAKYLQKICRGLKKCPVILFCKGSSLFYESLAVIQPQAISLDWQCDLKSVRQNVPVSIALQGNLDPDILLAERAVVQKEVKNILNKMRGDQGFIFNLGHGILPATPEENVHQLVTTIGEYY